MSNEYYDHTTYPAPNSLATSSGLRAELDAVEAGFNKLPTLAGNQGKPVKVKADGTALEAATLTSTDVSNFNAAASAAAPVQSVASKTGVVTLAVADVSGAVPDSRTLTAGNGLTGGGDLSANRTLTMGTPGTLTGSTTNAVTATSHTHALSGVLTNTGNQTTTGTMSATKLIPTGNVTAGNGMYLPTTDTVAVSTAGVERMRIDSEGRVGIGAVAPAYALRVNSALTGGPGVNGVRVDGQVQSGVTAITAFQSVPATAAQSFNITDLYHFSATQGVIGGGSSITNQYGFYTNPNLSGATNNYGFYSSIGAGIGRWNFYANGTAANYFAGPFAFKPGPSATPSNNGDLTFEATSNTTVTVKLRGTDGVVRSAALTLS